MRRLIPLLYLLLGCVAACNQPVTVAGETVALASSSQATPATQSSDRITDYDSLLRALLAVGAKPTLQESINHQFLSAPGKVVAIGSQRVQAFEYPDTATALADAERFSPDGAWFEGRGTLTLVNWIATPHLYRSDKLLVVYVGDDSETLDILERTLGHEFAGGANPYGVAMQVEP